MLFEIGTTKSEVCLDDGEEDVRLMLYVESSTNLNDSLTLAPNIFLEES